MACPVCNPLAIPLFGAAGVLSFLAPERGLIALLSIALLAVTLLLRLRTTQACRLTSTRAVGRKADASDQDGGAGPGDASTLASPNRPTR